ncbi:MAG TPA: cytochrome C [Rhodocyclaceae bacterium]
MLKPRLITNIAAVAAALGVGAAAAAPGMPDFYKNECGACHVAFPPQLLSPGGLFSDVGWLAIMRDLSDHYGSDASLDEPTRARIENYLTSSAASNERRFGSRSTPPRLTATLWFRRTHGGVKSRFASASVGSAANCKACHPRADQEDW